MGLPGRRRGVRHAGAPASAAAALALLIQENGMLFSRPLAFIGTNARKTIPAATFVKALGAPARRRRGPGRPLTHAPDPALDHESASAPKPPLARAPS